MKHQKIEIKNKIINNIICKGGKRTSEKTLLKSFKKLHIVSNKQFQKILKLSIILTISIFKFYEIKNKHRKKSKEVLKVLQMNNVWNFLAIKFVLKYLKIKKLKDYHALLSKEIFLNAWNEGFARNKKTILQKKISLKKKNFYYYRW